MRQAGILAAAGLISLNSMVDRLAEDHAHANLLAAKLNAIDGEKHYLGCASHHDCYVAIPDI